MDEKQFEKMENPEVSPAEENVSAPDCSEETAEVLLGEEDAAKEIAKLKQELAREKAQSNEHYTRLIRAQADFDNFRKRNQKEKDEFWKYASEPLLSQLLPVLDNFGRALDATPGDGEKFLEGIQMIYRQLYEVLENEGLEVIDAKGEEFDPNKHEAVMQEETDEYPDNTVIEEMQRGYMFKDKIIRPAMVKVARSS